jgi:hypothetical protein
MNVMGGIMHFYSELSTKGSGDDKQLTSSSQALYTNTRVSCQAMLNSDIPVTASNETETLSWILTN